MTSDNEAEELLYRSLDILLTETPADDKPILLGDFNARSWSLTPNIGEIWKRENQHERWIARNKVFQTPNG